MSETTRLVSEAAADLRGQFEEPDFWSRPQRELENWIEQAAVVLYSVAADKLPGQYADYEICPGCDRKALYVGLSDVPEGVEVWHAECRAEHAAAAVKAEREKIALALHCAESWDDIHAVETSLAAAPCRWPGHQPAQEGTAS